MKQSQYSSYPNLIFRETFNSEAECRRNGGTPIDVTFSNGVGSFNGTSSKVNYNLPLNGTYSVRIRCNPTSFADFRFLLDVRGTNTDGVGTIALQTGTRVVSASSGTSYVNGVATTATNAGVNNEIVATGISLIQGTGSNLSVIGLAYSNIRNFLGDIDLVEIYKGTLTASEVKNLYEDKWNKEVPQTLARQNLYPCDLSTTGWQRCADNTGTNAGANGVGQALRELGSGSGVGEGTDLVGFSSKLSGYRGTGNLFGSLSAQSYYWSSTSSFSDAHRRALRFNNSTVHRGSYSRGNGYSVRCLRDTNDTSDFTDPRDGNVYECVKIGTQVWMKRNLAYLPEITPAGDWDSDTEPQYAVYDYTGTSVEDAKATTNYQEHGVLYNWNGAMAACPDGWSVPSDEEWNILEKYVMGKISDSNPFDLLLDFDSTQGTIKDRTGKNSLTSTDVEIKKIGQSYSADFNGSTSKIDCGSDFIGTNAITVCGWIRSYSLNGWMVFNGKLILIVSASDGGRLVLTSNTGSNYVYSSDESLRINKWQFVAVTRTSLGAVNFYIGDLSNAPALSGIANQNAGTPVAGTSNLIIGNNNTGTQGLSGNISQLQVYEGILDLQTISQIWSESRKNYI